MPQFLSNFRRVAPVAAASLGLLLACSGLGDPVVEPDPTNPPPGTTKAPTLSPQGDTTVLEGRWIDLRFTAANPDSLPLAYALEGPGALNEGRWTWQPGLSQEGVHAVRLIVYVLGHPERADTASFKVTVLDDPAPPPQLALLPDMTVYEGRTATALLSASSPRGRALTYSVAGPPGVSLTGANFLWTPTYSQAGVYDVVFTVTEQGPDPRSSSQTIRITVIDVDRPPVLQALRDTVVDTSLTLRFTLSAIDPDGDAVTYSIVGAPPQGASLVGANFSWKPRAAQAGANVLRFAATAKGLSGFDTVVVLVTLPTPSDPPGTMMPAPIAYWSFDEGAGANVHDSTGTYPVTLYGSPTWVNGVSGKAVRFNGTPAQYGLAGRPLPNMISQTMSAWVYLDAIKYMTLIGESNSSNAHDNELSLEYLNGVARWMYRTKDEDPKGLHYAPSVPAPAAGKWYFIVGTTTGDTARVYVNGVLAGMNVSLEGFNLTGYHGNIEISRKAGYAYNVQGILDEIKVYSQALTPRQVEAEWNRHKQAAGY